MRLNYCSSKKLSVLVVLLLWCVTGYAQEIVIEESTRLSDSGQEKNESEELAIDVMAQKRKQKSQEVPTSISVLNARQIEDAGIASTEDIDSYVPNFSSYHCHDFFSFYSIRGQSNLVNSSNSVGVYIDDVPASIGSNQTTSNLYEIERIEVLRGPQGNLYGLNSAGGVVNIVTKKPDNFFAGKGQVSAGNYNARKYNMNLSGPLIEDTLFLGISGLYRTRESYVEENGNDERETSFACGRVQLRWLPLEKMELLFTGNLSQHEADHNDWSVIDDDPFEIENKGLTEKIDQDIDSESLRVHYATDFFDITSITARTGRDFEGIGGNDFLSGGLNKVYVDREEESIAYMEELRFTSNRVGDALQWIVGCFFYYEKDEGSFTQYVDTNSPYRVYAVKNASEGELVKKTSALFGQAGYTFFKKLTFTGGLRYDRDEQDIDCSYTQSSTSGSYQETTSWDAFSPKFIVDYRCTPSVMTYASIAKGFKAGGYSFYSTATTADDSRFDPEYTWSYETGVKTGWLQNRLICNIAFFYSAIEDLQIMTVDSTTSTQVYSNAAKADIYGGEAEISVRHLLEGLEIMGSASFLKSEIIEHAVEEYEGNNIPLAPSYQSGIAVQYTMNCGIFLRGEWNLYGKTYHNEANTYSQDNYTVSNATCGYLGEYVTVRCYIHNIFDKEYYTYTRSSGTYDLGIPGAPRTFGLSVSGQF